MTQAVPRNLVSMDDHAKALRGMSPREAVRLLHHCRDAALECLSQAFSSMVAQADDVLFDLAQKGENDAIQSAYFDAMRRLRLVRAEMAETFAKRLEEAYRQAMSRTARRKGAFPLLDISDISLGVIDEDDLEQTLAVDGMISKLRSGCEAGLFALDRRMGMLLNDKDLKNEDNPLSPESICSAGRAACELIGGDTKSTLIFLKLFDKHVVSLVSGLYEDLNQFLAQEGVLPKLRQGLPEREQPGEGTDAQGQGGRSWRGPPQPSPGEGELFARLHDLLSRTGDGAYTTTSGGIAAAAPEVLRQLTALQQGGTDNGLGSDCELSAETFRQGDIDVLRKLKRCPLGKAVAGVDTMILDIVAMLFDFILEDPNIPDAMKALIGRLQIPVLKAAMLDKSLFVKKSHPLRQLLNGLADAAVGWSESHVEEDRLFIKTEQIVERVLAEFQDDTGIFSELAKDFEAFLAEEEREAAERAEKSAKILKAREHLVLVKALAQEEVGRRVQGGSLPEPIKEFLSNQWLSLLTLHGLKQGESGKAWQRDLETMDDLSWSVAPKSTPEERAQMVTRLRSLLQRLKQGMETVSMEESEQTLFLATLARLHARAVSKGVRVAASPPPIDASPGTQDAVATDGPRDAAPPESGRERPGPDKDSERQADDMLQGNDAQLEEIIVTEHGVATDLDDEDDDHLLCARTLKPGTWVEFREEDGSKLRARLTWVSSVTGVYFFTDRRGLKAAERTLAGLAAEFRRGSARIIERVPLFDRAVTSVVDGLKNKA